MKKNYTHTICCSLCRGDLILKALKENENEIFEGLFYCEKCKNRYPIQDGIPNILPLKINNLVKEYFMKDSIVEWWDPENEKALFSEYLSSNNKIKKLLNDILIGVFKNINFRDKNVLDAGVGRGRFAMNIIERGASSVIGLDINTKMLTLTRDRIQKACFFRKMEFIQGDIENLPFSDNKLDVICCMETLIHIPNRNQAIREFFRVLKKNGILVVNVPFKVSYFAYLEYCSPIEILRGVLDLLKSRILYKSESHTHFITKRHFEYILLNAGFSIHKTIRYGKYFTMLTTYICIKK